MLAPISRMISQAEWNGGQSTVWSAVILIQPHRSPAGSNKSIDESSQNCKCEPALARNMKGELCERILVSSNLQVRRLAGSTPAKEGG